MTLQQLTVFSTTALYLNYRKASESLYITQPAVTKQINSLEKELGFRLFARNGRNVALTPAGELFYKFAQQTIDAFNSTVRECRQVQLNNTIEICCSTNIRSEVINESAARFIRQYPNAGIRFEYCDTADMVSAIRDKTYDVYIVHNHRLNINHSDLAACVLETKRSGFLAKVGYMGITEQPSDVSVYNGCEFLDPMSESKFTDDIGKLFNMPIEKRIANVRRLGLYPSKFTHKSNWQSVMASVQMGLGITMVDEEIWHELPKGYFWIETPMRIEIQADWYVYNDKPELKNFLAIIKEVKQQSKSSAALLL